MTGQRYGRLTVVRFLERNVTRGSLWLCQCDCGKTRVVDRRNLISGNTKSCGCLLKEMIPSLREPAKRPKPKNEPIEICEQGAANLIRAIIRQASNDVMRLPPSSYTRVEAIRFFQSDYFKCLTGLEGEPILRYLLAEYERKHQKKHKEIKR